MKGNIGMGLCKVKSASKARVCNFLNGKEEYFESFKRIFTQSYFSRRVCWVAGLAVKDWSQEIEPTCSINYSACHLFSKEIKIILQIKVNDDFHRH